MVDQAVSVARLARTNVTVRAKANVARSRCQRMLGAWRQSDSARHPDQATAGRSNFISARLFPFPDLPRGIHEGFAMSETRESFVHGFPLPLTGNAPGCFAGTKTRQHLHQVA